MGGGGGGHGPLSPHQKALGESLVHGAALAADLAAAVAAGDLPLAEDAKAFSDCCADARFLHFRRRCQASAPLRKQVASSSDGPTAVAGLVAEAAALCGPGGWGERIRDNLEEFFGVGLTTAQAAAAEHFGAHAELQV